MSEKVTTITEAGIGVGRGVASASAFGPGGCVTTTINGTGTGIGTLGGGIIQPHFYPAEPRLDIVPGGTVLVNGEEYVVVNDLTDVCGKHREKVLTLRSVLEIPEPPVAVYRPPAEHDQYSDRMLVERDS